MEPITATYTRDENQFRIVVTGHAQSQTGTAPDIIAAHELAKRLATQLIPAAASTPVVVHLLDGSGVAFTRALLTRPTRPDTTPMSRRSTVVGRFWSAREMNSQVSVLSA